LRQILRSEFATHTQLFDFMQLNHYERSRKSFDWRLRRLMKHGFVLGSEMPACGGQLVYSVARSGALLLQGMGEYYLLGRERGNGRSVEPNVLHAVELNEIHLSLLRAGLLVRWIPAIEIRSQNELTTFGYAKDYDAIVTVRAGERDERFALEYERSPKAAKYYKTIAATIAHEAHVDQILYLAPNYDLLRFVSAFFTHAKRRVYFGLLRDWHEHLLDMPVCYTSTSDCLRFQDVLNGAGVRSGTRAADP
jgi:hypothetical protein